MNIESLLLAMSIPSAITAFCFWLLQRSITKRDKAKAEKEKSRDTLLYLVIQSVDASIDLSTAIAKAVQRIPDAHCNGDMDAALESAKKVREKQKQYLTQQGIKQILDI